LEALPDDQWEALPADLWPVTFPAESLVFDAGKPIDWVLFPLDLVVSLVTPLAEGAVEIATIRNDGIVGVPLAAGADGSVRALTPSVGGLAMEAPKFLAALDRWEAFRGLMDRYVLALFGEISQIGACNRMHSNEERLSRWLLMTHDEAGRDTFPATHHLLGRILGCRCATISNAAGLLQGAGFIRYSRGRMTIFGSNWSGIRQLRVLLEGARRTGPRRDGHHPDDCQERNKDDGGAVTTHNSLVVSALATKR
jgi:hypothetical protein